MKARDLMCEFSREPLGVPKHDLRLSWSLEHEDRDEVQTSFRVEVKDAVSGEQVWDSGRVNSASQFVAYTGPTLSPGRRYRWRVKWWDKEGRESEWSDWSSFVTGLDPEDWKATWITGGQLMRKEFSLNGEDIASAFVFVTGLGYYELRLNGSKVGDRVLDPGWSDYDRRVLYSVYDVTGLLRDKNAFGVILGRGRYVDRYGYKAPQGLLLQLLVTSTDGKSVVITSDLTWKTSAGPITSDDIYAGESYDARQESEGWDRPGYDDSSWSAAVAAEQPRGKLVAETFPPVRVVGEDKPLSVDSPSPGVYVYDFGQNFTGWVRVRASAPRGTTMKIRYAELLDDQGNLNVKNLRGALATDSYTFKGEGVEEFAPHFTYHGFRYAEITGLPAVPSIESVSRQIVHSDVEVSGGFSCSDGVLNRIHSMVVRGQLSNLMSVPTDCPQRDERMGWMGDAQLTAEEAILNFWMPAFYENWVSEMEESQKDDGEISDVVPPFWKIYPADPAWGVAFLEIPWLLHVYYGDDKPIKEHYDAMKKWVEFLISRAPDKILKIIKYGDWCPPSHIVPPETPRELTDTWYLHRSLSLISKMASLLGRGDEAKKYEELAASIADAFNSAFYNKDHYGPGNGSQTCDVLALWAGMAKDKEAVAKHLIHDVEVEHDRHLNTGIIGTRYLFDVLSDLGRADLAYSLVVQPSYPGYGYMIREGATTLWERWELLTGGAMNSHNHIMFGSVDSWFYRRVAGISVDENEPAFSHVIFRPLNLGLKYATASIRTVKGLVHFQWSVDGRSFRARVSLPVGSRGSVYLQGVNPKEGGRPVVVGQGGVLATRVEGSETIVEVGSGTYDFSSDLPREGDASPRF